MVVDGVGGAEAGAGLADAAGFADCWAFALSLSKRKATITQCRIRISQPKSRFRFCLQPVLRSVIRKAAIRWRSCSSSSSPARCLLGACSDQQQAGGCVSLTPVVQAWSQCRAEKGNFLYCI